jgi:hypothetical protein
MTMPNHDPGSLRTIVTLSAPHALPRLHFDGEMVEVYDRIHRFWGASQRPLPSLPAPAANSTNTTGQEQRFLEVRHQHELRRNVLEDTVLISIAGGHHDIFIPASLCKLPWYVPAHWRRHQTACGDTVLTSSMRRMGFSVDHQAILWCRQLVRSVTVALIADTRAIVSGVGDACKEGEGKAEDGKCADGENSAGNARLQIMMAKLQVETAVGKTQPRSFERQLKLDDKILRTAAGTAWVGGDGSGEEEASSLAAYLPLSILEPLLPPVPALVLQKYGPMMLLPLWTLLTLLMFTVPQFEWLQGERGAKVTQPSTRHTIHSSHHHPLITPSTRYYIVIGQP